MVASLFAATIFLSAFLLFQVQPILGRFILPWFGGSPAVWTTCMLFFQLLVMAGYGYAHLITLRLGPRGQAILHFILILVLLVWLPIAPSGSWKPSGTENPVWRILGLLSASIGLPFFLLSATSPLLQGWFSRRYPGRVSYRLYALSNAGSLLALVSYPLAVEPALPLSAQAKIWSWTCGIFAFLSACCAVSVYLSAHRRSTSVGALLEQGASSPPPEAGSNHRFGNALLWFGLSACGVTMLLATTNQMCQDVAVVPFLWILPLVLYLLSFIICFAGDSAYHRGIFGVVLVIATAQACAVLFKGVSLRLVLQIASYAFTLFACCMICHGELSRLKPPAAHLTAFYLVLSAGGVVSGILVILAAPALLSGYWEFHLALAFTWLLFLFVLFRDARSRLHSGRPVWAWATMILAYCALIVTLVLHVREARGKNIMVARNFYGVMRVREENNDDSKEHRYTLMHGRIEHGFQFRDAQKRYWPTSYYGSESGLGLAITTHPRRLAGDTATRGLRIGVIGLGTGTIASYGEQGDYLCFYEINPDVVRLSDKCFTYRQDTPAKVEVVLGDARVSLERSMTAGDSQQFDVLAVDAFASDAIPVHLLTEECFRIYWYHLKEDGILAVHISNRYFELSPVVRVSALLSKGRGVEAMMIRTAGSNHQGTDACDWLIATNNKRFLESGVVRTAAEPWPKDQHSALLWTDDYCNLLAVLKTDEWKWRWPPW